jgi:hypothetical protein
MANFDWRLREKFLKEATPEDALDVAVDWIKENLAPDDVFSDEQLEEWAEDNGYVLESAE